MSPLPLHDPFASLGFLDVFRLVYRARGIVYAAQLASITSVRYKDTLEVKILGNWADVMFSPRQTQKVVVQGQMLKELLA